MEQLILTAAQLQELATLVENILRSRTSGVGEVEIVSSLDGLTSFPTIYEAGGVRKVVRVQMSVLGNLMLSVAAPNLEALAEAVAAAEQVIRDINAVIARASGAADRAEAALGALQALIDESRAATGRAGAAAENADAKAAFAQEQGTRAGQQADAAQAKIVETEAARQAAVAATAEAVEVADHPPMIGIDGYWYFWNKLTNAYDKSAYFSKGDPFRISHTYASQEEMMADFGNLAIPPGSFVLINTDDVEHEHNAQIWIKTDTTFQFVVDMSGAQGFTGKTPQLIFIRPVTGAAGSEAAVSQSPGGQDDEGNPIERITLTIPRGDPGKPSHVLPNGNWGNWNEETGRYDDSGVPAEATVDMQNTPVEFTEAAARVLPTSGETTPTVFGKLLKWLRSLGALAFKDRIDYTADVDNALALATSTELPQPPGTASAGTAGTAARADHVHGSDTGKVDKSGTSSTATTTMYVYGATTAAGTTPRMKPVSTSVTSGHIAMRSTGGNTPAPKAVDLATDNYIGAKQVKALLDEKAEATDLDAKQDAAPNGTDPLIGTDGKINAVYAGAGGGGGETWYVPPIGSSSQITIPLTAADGTLIWEAVKNRMTEGITLTNRSGASVSCEWEEVAYDVNPEEGSEVFTSIGQYMYPRKYYTFSGGKSVPATASGNNTNTITIGNNISSSDYQQVFSVERARLTCLSLSMCWEFAFTQISGSRAVSIKAMPIKQAATP